MVECGDQSISSIGRLPLGWNGFEEVFIRKDFEWLVIQLHADLSEIYTTKFLNDGGVENIAQ